MRIFIAVLLVLASTSPVWGQTPSDEDESELLVSEAKDRLAKLSTLFINPTLSVGVKDINSRVVSITGGVEKPGQYKILAPMDVVQVISLAGGLREYTSGKSITIIRGDGAKQTSFKFNYKEVLEGKNLKQNIPLQPGDRVLVPE